MLRAGQHGPRITLLAGWGLGSGSTRLIIEHCEYKNLNIYCISCCRWFGKCWHVHNLLKYEFDIEFDVSK